MLGLSVDAARAVGTVCVVIGLVVLFFANDTPFEPGGRFFGSLFIVSGLLIRIEGAVVALRRRQSD